MESVSIIVPIFRGRKFIKGLIRQLEICADICKKSCALELVLVNDDPTERIGEYTSEKIRVKVFETDINRGIHGARVWGLEYCIGNYVLFLDQDDKIRPEYFSSQFSHLNNADAVVCKLLHESRQYYDTRMPFEEVVTREYIISVRNPIISPGQVLIRKDKIPELWRETELKNNGADDWLLWISMQAQNCKFDQNPNVLFEHVVEGENESINAKHMIDSEREIYQIVKEKEILKDRELEAFQAAIHNAENDHIKVLSKFQRMFFVYNTWMMLYEQGIRLEDYLIQHNIFRIAIYGFSYIGKRLYYCLRESRVCAAYFIDMNAEYLEDSPIPICRPDVVLEPVDMIIISLTEGVDTIKKKIMENSNASVCTIVELFDNMKR